MASTDCWAETLEFLIQDIVVFAFLTCLWGLLRQSVLRVCSEVCWSREEGRMPLTKREKIGCRECGSFSLGFTLSGTEWSTHWCAVFCCMLQQLLILDQILVSDIFICCLYNCVCSAQTSFHVSAWDHFYILHQLDYHVSFPVPLSHSDFSPLFHNFFRCLQGPDFLLR